MSQTHQMGHFCPMLQGPTFGRGAALPPLGAKGDPRDQDCLAGAPPSNSSPLSRCPLKAPLPLSATAQSLWLKASLEGESATCTDMKWAGPEGNQVLSAWVCETSHMSPKALPTVFPWAKSPALWGLVNPDLQPTPQPVSVLSGRSNNKWMSPFRDEFKPSDWLVGKSEFAQRVFTLSHPRHFSYCDLTTHPSRGSPHPTPRPRQTSRHANMNRVLQTSLCVLSEALSWLTVRPLVCETSCLAVRIPRTHRGTWKGFLGHDYD